MQTFRLSPLVQNRNIYQFRLQIKAPCMCSHFECSVHMIKLLNTVILQTTQCCYVNAVHNPFSTTLNRTCCQYPCYLLKSISISDYEINQIKNPSKKLGCIPKQLAENPIHQIRQSLEGIMATNTLTNRLLLATV